MKCLSSPRSIGRWMLIPAALAVLVLAEAVAPVAPTYADPAGTPDSSCDGPGASNSSCIEFTSGSVGAESCNGLNACHFAGRSGSATIGDYSCNGEAACYQAGDGGSAEIGRLSCHGLHACNQAGGQGTALIGDGSCRGSSACNFAGWQGAVTIGSFACNGGGACAGLGVVGTIDDCQRNTVPVPECDAWPRYDADLEGVCNRGSTGPLCAGADLCPNTPTSQRPVDANGCSQQQVDSDMDGVCNRGLKSSLCYGSDLCPRHPGPGTTNGCPGGPSIVTRLAPVRPAEGAATSA